MARRDGNKQARGRQPQSKGPKGARPARKKERTLRESDYTPTKGSASAAVNAPHLMLSDRVPE